ncbi:hypothetical protein Sj15T_11970 [Sphingobium sp. TA15]|uniref:TonB-dependent receptor-like protein n=1 Tax=Sphingobium indicum (strain DSM 16413 / CCM 7287 / MTCC 6362 / UT26 / NBRC 101211 / UT26S) TaxID=452662 RepID=D4Z2A9_SPHIU|nr:hypothetical protein [Sphingobium indicum]BAI96741.1 TonB-dependent receptor-like protein [Sphingobium indicum UT26S]BDD66176.1 hypothetical protein Sj15T_11970 [Sphingobium sp. TA15]
MNAAILCPARPALLLVAAAIGLPVESWAQDSAPPAVPAGRADENAVRQAEDAFGTTIGRETIGIYSSSSVRGFG